ncbi:YceI family protein [Allomuricauda sp. CP2A]|uniref:YceI family protein n=1 Tax=Allomuricauda sp. CP2A TaxID=1848189 RepID=UPI0011479819|nr:YceI family protein [Muricauda sp. CP2A]
MKKEKLHKSVSLLMFLNVVCLGFAQSTVWKIDPSHSTLGFSIDHLVVSETVGEFKDYSVNVVSDEKDFSDAKISVVIQSKSIDTEDEKRDEHLQSPDFFDVDKYPQIVFKSDEFHKSNNGEYRLSGTLQMHGITKKIALNAKFGGIVKDPWGGTRAGLKIWGVLDRYDYGLKYNSIMEAGGLSIGREVRIDCRVELIKE